MNSGDHVWLMNFALKGDFIDEVHGSDVYSTRRKALAGARAAVRNLLVVHLGDEKLIDKAIKDWTRLIKFSLSGGAFSYECRDPGGKFYIYACADNREVK